MKLLSIKKSFIILFFALFSITSTGQTIVFEEDFETLPLDFTQAGTVSWDRSSFLQASGNYCDTVTIVLKDTADLISSAFSTSGLPFVSLEFDHICKFAWNVDGRIEVSVDNGVNWIQLTGSEYQGGGLFNSNGDRFTASSYPITWEAAAFTSIPNNTWWKHEKFDISSIVGDTSSVMVRFRAVDANGSGGLNHYGWLIDNVKVIGSAHELDAPLAELIPPILDGIIYETGPFDIFAKMSDASGIDTAYIVYTIAGINDTIPMEVTTYDTANIQYRKGTIPSLPYGTSFCYKVVVIDLSGASNSTNIPGVGCLQVEIIKPFDEITIGTGGNNGYIAPMYNDSVNDSKKYSQHISLFKAVELDNREARFEKLAWNKTSFSGYQGSNAQLKIYIKHTTSDTVQTSSGSFAAAKVGATLVYDSTGITLPLTEEWLEFAFNIDTFQYDGSQNAMILVEWYRPDTLTNPQIKWQFTNTLGRAVTFAGSSANPSTVYGLGHLPNTKIFSRARVFSYDVGVYEVVTPEDLVVGNNTQDINVRVKNYGSDTITKMNIHYSIDGQAIQTYAWTGSLNPDLATSDILIGASAYVNGSHSIKAWTTMPNDSTDGYMSNDTLSKAFYVCSTQLNGAYTVGGSSADFQTFQEIENSLNTCGITGPVTFYINPGTYYEHISIEDVLGASSTNTITFKSSTNNADDVKLSYSAQSAEHDYVFKFDSANWVILKNISLESTGSTYSTLVLLSSTSQNNIIDSCKLYSGPLTGYGYTYGIVSSGENVSYNIISNNLIDGIGYGVYLHASSNRSKGNVIKGNKIVNFKKNAIDLLYQDSIHVNGNTIENIQNGNNLKGIYIKNGWYNTKIENNKIDLEITTGASGISILSSNGKATVPNLIANNTVNIRGASNAVSRVCFEFTGTTPSTNFNVYHNSFALYTGGNTSKTFYINSGTNIKLVNNIFSNFNQGMCIEYGNSATTPGSVSNSDFNSFYSNGIIYGKWGYSNSLFTAGGVAALSAFSGMDTNSVFTDPLFYSTSNMHSFSSILDGAATTGLGITHDIDGDLRNTATPDIGADEFTISSADAGIIGLLNPIALDTQSRVTSPQVLIRNFGSNAITSMQIKYQIDGGASQVYTYTGNLASAAIDTVSLPSLTVPVLNFELLVFTQLTGDTLNANDSMSFSLYGLPLVDLELVEMPSPVDGCELDTSEVVKIKIKNIGLNTISSGITASYQVLGSSTVVTESVTSSINPGADIIFTFNTKIDLTVSQDSIFVISTFVSHTADPIADNDTNVANVLSLGTLAAPIVSDTLINYGNPVTLTAVSPYNTVWYETDTSTTALAYAASYTTPQLFDTTTYYVESNTNVPALDIVIGNAVTVNSPGSQPCPYNSSGEIKLQFLFLASELISQGIVAGSDITSLSFYIQSSTYANTQYGYTVKLGQTSQSSLTSSFITSGLTQVYLGNHAESIGWNTHSFQAPFNWDGASNLVVQICALNSNYGNPQVRYSATSFNSVSYYDHMFNACGVSSGGTLSTNRPNTRFTTNPVLGCSGTRAPLVVNVPLAAIESDMDAILSPNQSCGLDSAVVECQIINRGTDTIPGGYSVSYQIDNGTFITPEVVNINIAPGDTLVYPFNTIASLISGPIGTTYSITSAISTPNDFYNINDTVTRSGIWSEYTASEPIIAATPAVTYGDSVTLNAMSNDTVFWYDDVFTTNLIGEGASQTIGPLFDTTIVYLQSQKTVPLSPFDIGAGTAINTTSTGPSPYGGSQSGWGTRNQFLIHASEMRAMGMLKGEIESLAFYVNTASGVSLKDYSIKIGTTNMDELSSFATGLTTIYSSLAFGEALGWNTHTFPAPIYWDGTSNIVIETCFKNTAWVGGYSKCTYSTTSFVSSLSSYSGINFSCSDTIQDASYYKRPNIRFTAKGYGSCTSGIVAHQINIQGVPTIDAGVVKIVSPNGTVSPSIAEDIKVVVKNYGLNTLTSLAVNWMDRDMITHTYNWTGTLASGAIDTLTIGSQLFLGGQTRLYSWTSNPNNITDTIQQNDSAYTDLDICMQGIYTVGSGMNYTTLQHAFDDLSISTVCGSVVLDIDTGIYLNQYVLSNVTGIDENNTLTIKSIGNDSSTVHLTFGTNPAANYVIKLVNSPYVTFKHITLNANGNNTSNAIVLTGNTHHIDVQSCVFNSSTNISGTAQASGVYADGSLIEFINIDNNLFNNGYRSVYFKGSFSDRQKGITISNNTMNGFQEAAVFMNYQDSMTIVGNTATSGLLGTSVYGFEISNTQNSFKVRNNMISLSPVSSAKGIKITGSHGTSTNRGVIANNMISVYYGSGALLGAELYNVTNSDFVYNSINIVNGTANNIGSKVNGGSDLKILNNVFYTRKGRVLEITTTTALTSWDYNDYYTDTINNQLFVKFVLTDVSDLNALKALDPNKNVHSISVDPSFYSKTDLHSFELGLDGSATPISHTIIDFDGESRNTTTPDIGADEFTLSPIDLGAIKLNHPNSSGCNFTSSDSIVVQVRNYGTSTIDFTTLPATLTVYSTGVNPDTISYVHNTGSIAPGDFMDIKVSTTFNLAMIGLYIFDANVNIAGDGNALNDAMPTQEFVYYQTISNFPFYEDFESGVSHYLGTHEGVETQMAILQSAASSGTYGMRYTGGDNSSFVPNTTVDDAYGHIDHVARLYSCQVDASSLSALNLRFDLKQTYAANAYGSWFRVIIEDQNGLHYATNLNGDTTFRPNSNILDPFVTHTFVLDSFVGQNISVYLEAAVGKGMNLNGFGDNVYIDNISIWSPVNTDLGLKAITSLDVGYMKTGTVHHPKIAVENYGASTITSIPVSYSINGQAPLWDTITTSLGSSQSDTLTMNASIVILSGNQELCIIAHVPGDSVVANDTACSVIKGLDSFNLNFEDDFEGTNQWFGKGVKNQWEMGVPNSTNFTSAYSGTNAYVTNLNSDYQVEAVEYLYTPYFYLPLAKDTITLSFMHKMQVQPQLAYGYIQYSFNGLLWIDLGYLGDPNSHNWYTSNLNGKHSWSNQTSNWVHSSIDLDSAQFNVGANIQFRFGFTSLTAIQVLDGWMIDDFKISLPDQQYDAGATQVVLPDSNSNAGMQTPVEVTIHNFGYDTLYNIPVAYKVDGLNEIVEAWSGILLPDSSINYMFNTTYTSPSSIYNLCAYTKLAADINTSNNSVCKNVTVVAPNWDAAVVDINEVYDVNGNIVTIKVTNLGSNAISQLPVQFMYGSSFVSNVENLSVTLNQGDTVSYVFTQQAPSIVGSTLLCGKTLLSSDQIPSNDEVCKGTTNINDIESDIFTLNQNRPNPFTTYTEISYTLPKAGDVQFRIMSVMGSIILEEEHKDVQIKFSRNYDLSHLSPGIYYYSIEFEGRLITKKMIVR